MKPTRPGKERDPEARVAIQTEADRQDRNIAERQACALECIARDLHGLHHVAHFIANILNDQQQGNSGMTDEQKAALTAKAAAITAKLDDATAKIAAQAAPLDAVK